MAPVITFCNTNKNNLLDTHTTDSLMKYIDLNVILDDMHRSRNHQKSIVFCYVSISCFSVRLGCKDRMNPWSYLVLLWWAEERTLWEKCVSHYRIFTVETDKFQTEITLKKWTFFIYMGVGFWVVVTWDNLHVSVSYWNNQRVAQIGVTASMRVCIFTQAVQMYVGVVWISLSEYCRAQCS